MCDFDMFFDTLYTFFGTRNHTSQHEKSFFFPLDSPRGQDGVGAGAALGKIDELEMFFC